LTRRAPARLRDTSIERSKAPDTLAPPVAPSVAEVVADLDLACNFSSTEAPAGNGATVEAIDMPPRPPLPGFGVGQHPA
jgi:hypothetical protein